MTFLSNMAFKIINKKTGFEETDDKLCLKPDGNIYRVELQGYCCETWIEFIVEEELMAKYDT